MLNVIKPITNYLTERNVVVRADGQFVLPAGRYRRLLVRRGTVIVPREASVRRFVAAPGAKVIML